MTEPITSTTPTNPTPAPTTSRRALRAESRPDSGGKALPRPHLAGSSFLPPGHMPALDGLRGLAILGVLFAHYTFFLSSSRGGPIENAVIWLSSFGGMGVDLFFVLSGFLITGILLDSRDSGSFFKTFYARRTLRIFPLYYAFLFLVIGPLRAIDLRVGLPDPFAHTGPIWHLLYVANLHPERGMYPPEFAHLWSLAVEEQFYLIWPLFIYFVPRRFLKPICLAGVVFALGLRSVMVAKGSWFESIHRWTPARVDTLLLGALVAIAIREAGTRALMHKLIKPVAAASGALLVLIYGTSLMPGWSVMTIGWTAFAFFFASVVAWAATTGAGNPVLMSARLRALGKYSYGIYVLHMIGMNPAYVYLPLDTLARRLGVIALLLTMTAGLTALSWVALEAPLLRLKRHFPYAPPAGRPVPEAADRPTRAAASGLVASAG